MNADDRPPVHLSDLPDDVAAAATAAMVGAMARVQEGASPNAPLADSRAAACAAAAAARGLYGPGWGAMAADSAGLFAVELPRRWTSPDTLGANLRHRWELIATGVPSDWTREGMARALVLDHAGDALERGTVQAGAAPPRVGGSPAGDDLAREWAKRMAAAARKVIDALALLDADNDRLGGWVACICGVLGELADAMRANNPPAAEVARDLAAELRALQEQAEVPGAPSLLLLTLLSPDLACARLTWAWSVRGRWEAKRPKAAALAAPAAQAVLALRTRKPALRRWTEGGRELAEVDTAAGPVRLDPFVCATMPRDVADRLVAGDLRDLRSKAGLGVLDAVLRALDAELAAAAWRDAAPPGWRPTLALPADKPLAEACGLARRRAADAEAALRAWSAVYQGDHRGTLQRFILPPERRPAAPGRTAAWLVVPGLLLTPADLAADASARGKAGRLDRNKRGWRRLMPWPDVAPPDDWTDRTCDRADAGFIALSLVLDWTEATGRDHGCRWRDAPGVLLDDRRWALLVDRTHAAPLLHSRGAALDAWGGAGWVELDGDRVAPGPALSRLGGVLDKAAEGARAARGKGDRRKG